MEVDSETLWRQRDDVWKMIIQFICYEYCMDFIYKNELEDKNFRCRITSDLLKDLAEYQMTGNDTLSLYQLLTQFVIRSNKLLEESCFEEQSDIIEECTELLKELCSISSNLKPMEQHINNLFKDIKFHDSHNNEEEITEWKNVFAGSRTILIKEMLQLLAQPYLLKMVQNCNSNYILEINKNVTAAVDLLRSVHFEEKVIRDLKRKLIKDDALVHIMRNSSTDYKDQMSTTSPEDSYKTAASAVSTISNNKQDKNSRKLSNQLLQKESKTGCTDRITRRKTRNSRVITSSYFVSPQPLPKVNIKRYTSSWRKALVEEMKRPLSPPSSTASSRNYNGVARKRISWTFTEEELLVLGVEKYNVGNWRLILADGGLENRTVRDLYDKWKNIQKYGHLDAIKARLRKKDKLKHSE